MSKRRPNFFGMFAVLLALMAQLGAVTTAPRIDPIATSGVVCHTDDDAGDTPSPGPAHPADCPVCPLCGAIQTPGTLLLSEAVVIPPPAVQSGRRVELPPPSTAPPSPRHPSSQPRAPPVFS